AVSCSMMDRPATPTVAWAPARGFSTAHDAAYSAPAAIERMIEHGRKIQCGALGIASVHLSATHDAAIAPMIIWPSTPMFHSPAVKVISRPIDASSSGTQNASVRNVDWGLPNAPSHSALNVCTGSAW